MPLPEFYQTVSSKLAEIEKEMKSIGLWERNSLDPRLFEDMGPFGNNTMSFENWLQFVFFPIVNEIIEHQKDFPESSQIGTYAAQVFDAFPTHQHLTHLLCEFDDLFH